MTTFAIHTLGCKVNQTDGEALAAKLTEAGYVQTPFNAPADIFLINTCTVTHTVDKKSLQYIRRARRRNADAFIAVCGCMARNENEAPKPDSADFVFDTRKPEALLEALATRQKSMNEGTPTRPPSVLRPLSSVFSKRTRAFLKVQDGCDRFCAYCIVPYVRGALRSTPPEEAAAQAAALAADGAKEIVLTGIQLAAYGKNDTEADSFGRGAENNTPANNPLCQLLARIAATPGLRRLRLSSVEPCVVDEAFLLTASRVPVLCEHFHLSLQSGCDATLARMGRRYTTAEYARKAQQLRAHFPGAALTTDIIVGFPGETDGDFAQTITFVEEMRFARIHVFPYSPRKGTAAADMPHQVPAAVKKHRAQALLRVAAEARRTFLAAQLHCTHEVLFETHTSGHTRNYCSVRTHQPATPNELRHVHITGFGDDSLQGELL